MQARAVIGASFGDEGKGLTVDYLASTTDAEVVVRYNAGAQAGHTVVCPDGRRHVFSHFGSGSFLGLPTYLSQFFVCNPIMFMKEMKQLTGLGVTPRVYAHPDCLVTTFADMVINQKMEDKRGKDRHGSVGVGFAETIHRSSLPHLKITMSDLWNKTNSLESKLTEICDKYARFRIGEAIDFPGGIETFIKGCRQFANLVEPLGIAQCKNPLFEGAQGLLLDQDNKEFFPHVTRSNTGMKNVRTLCAQAGISDIEAYYVSRTYLTRHGAGQLPGEDPSLSYIDKTNIPHDYQGRLRFAPLDAAEMVRRCAADYGSDEFKLVLTHCDQKSPPTARNALLVSGETRGHVSHE